MLQQVDVVSYGCQVNFFLGCVVLDVGDIGVQDLMEVFYGIVLVGVGENLCMYDSVQGRFI